MFWTAIRKSKSLAERRFVCLNGAETFQFIKCMFASHMRHEYFDSHPLSGKFYICHYGGAGERRESVLLRRTLFRSINVIRIFASAFGLFHTIVYHSPPYYVPLTVILAWSCEYILCSCGCHEPAAFNSWGFVVYRGKRVFRVAYQTTCKGSGDTLKCSSIYSGTGRLGERNFFEW